MIKDLVVNTGNGNTHVHHRPTWAEVDLKAIEYNYRQVRKAIDSNVCVMAIVKANAYGHGTVEISRVLESCGVDYLGVASTDEAVSIRDHHIKTPILILGSVLPAEVPVAIEKDITLSLGGEYLLDAVQKTTNGGRKLKVHIKIDTGMGRIGIWHENALGFVKKVSATKGIVLEGIYTHFTSTGRDSFFTNYQIESFEQLLSAIEKSWIKIPLKHAANSAATVDFKRSHLNMVRPGLVIYGMYPKYTFPKLITLKPALSLKTKIVFIKETPPGRSISYGRTYITQKHTVIATLPIGYADGYSKRLSNHGEVLVRGHRARIVGRVTMDQTMIDVGHIKGVKVGDEVALIGKQGSDEIRAEALGRLADSIAYEVVCSISNRVPRVYK